MTIGYRLSRVTFEDFTLAELGNSVTIALRQQTVDGGDNVIGFFDAILVTGEDGGLLGDYDESGRSGCGGPGSAGDRDRGRQSSGRI